MSALADAPFLTAQAAPQAAGLTDAPFAMPARPRAAEGPLEALQAGYQGSGTGLAIRGKLPDIVLDGANAKWYEKALSSIGQMGAELPQMVVGAAGGGIAGTAAGGPVGGILGGGAGAFAVPAAIRQSLIEAYKSGTADSSGGFLNSVGIILKTTSKEGVVGAATMGAGGLAARVVGKAIAPAIGEAITVGTGRAAIGTAATAAEIGTMVVTPAALDGHLPEWSDFVNAAVVVGFAKGAVHMAAPAVSAVAGKMGDIYAKTGIRPEQVAADAQRDPTIAAELKSDGTEIPAAYRPQADAETVANAMPDPKPLESVLANINAPIPEGKTPGHINYKYVQDAEGLHAIFAAGSAAFEKQIAEKRAAPKGWDQSLAEARATLAEAQGRKAGEIPQGTPALDAQMLQNNAMLIDAAADLKSSMKAVAEAGSNATEAQVRSQMLAAQNMEATLAFTLGKNAEVARALNVLKATKQMTALASDIAALKEKYGTDPVLFAKIGLEMDTPAKMATLLRTATVWEKVVEGWKAGILSGPVTHIANIIGNGTFMAMRPVIDLTAAAIGKVTGAQDRVVSAEPFARVFGGIQGAKDALQLAGSAMRLAYEEGGIKGVIKEVAVGKEGEAAKAEIFRKAIEGTKGDIIRLPFRALQIADGFFKAVNERGEAYALATRQAISEGFNISTREFRERVVDLVQNDVSINAAAAEAGLRFTFNMPLGETGLAVSALVRKAKLELFVPFIRTPGNILKELARMTPLAPLVGEWRTAIAEGGAKQAQALAEIGMGTAIMGVVGSYALDGSITGQLSPDAGKKRVQTAAGIQPYSIKIGDTYYNYQRLQPIGTLIGMAADMAEMWDHLTADEADKLPKMVSVAFANAVTNQTFLQGITNIVNAMSDPKRFGPKLVQGMAASTVPAIIGQPTTMSDPFVREINSVLDAVRSRIPSAIPGGRDSLLAKRDVWGTEVSTKSRLAGVSPVTETIESTDPVRTEAERLGVTASEAPKKVHLGKGSGKLGDVEISPEQRNKFTEVSGKFAHDILEPVVASPMWKELPDIVQKRIYAKAFTTAHKRAAIEVFTGEERTVLIGQITQRVQEELRP